jgi:hypothetical protein
MLAVKKPSKKLALASETIRELRRADLVTANGGRRPPTISDLSCTDCQPPTTDR